MSEAAADVKVIFSADTSAWGPQLTKANAQAAQLGQTMKKTAADTRREMMEAKGSIAVLGEEIGVRLPRHVRNFVATLPGVAGAMSAAFNAVAVFAIADAVFQAGEKLAEFVRKNEEAARKNAEAWRNTLAPMRLTNDQLALANDSLEPKDGGRSKGSRELDERGDRRGDRVGRSARREARRGSDEDRRGLEGAGASLV